jgi:hypothetical protein
MNNTTAVNWIKNRRIPYTKRQTRIGKISCLMIFSTDADWKTARGGISRIRRVRRTQSGRGKGYQNYKSEYQAMVDTGILPNRVPARYKKKLEHLNIIKKKRRGVYLTTQAFDEAIGRYGRNATEGADESSQNGS